MKITCHMIMSVDLSTTPPPVSQRFMKPLMQNYPQTAGSSDAKPWPSTALMS